jgi:hypothetical protein
MGTIFFCNFIGSEKTFNPSIYEKVVYIAEIKLFLQAKQVLNITS